MDAREHIVGRLGILGLNLTDQIRQMLPAVRVPTGVVVASTMAGAIDSRDGGFAPGDVIYAINRVPVSGLSELRALLETLRIGDPSWCNCSGVASSCTVRSHSSKSGRDYCKGI